LSESVGVQNPTAEPSYREFRKNEYNLLFHGDNKEILSSLLTAGFLNRIDLIYIDPTAFGQTARMDSLTGRSAINWQRSLT